MAYGMYNAGVFLAWIFMFFLKTYLCFVQVTVENLDKGIHVNVYSERSCPGLVVFVLKVFEDLNLNVLEARVSCTGSFQLEALGIEVIYVIVLLIASMISIASILEKKKN